MIEPRLWSIILAGGSGTRLKDVTRAWGETSVPKQFCRFGGSRSLLQDTVERIRPLVPAERCTVVVDRAWSDVAVSQLPGVQVVAQPMDRGTAAGVLLPLLHVYEEDSESIVILLPSDHAITDATLFRACLHEVAEAVANREASVVLLGCHPDAPRNDYGWITPGPRVGKGMHEVAGFVEKPSLLTAERLQQSGAVWNTMILVGSVGALLERFELILPEVTGTLKACMKTPGDLRGARLRDRYPHLPARDFSRDLLGRARRLALYVLPPELAWSDLGTPERLFAWLAGDGAPDRRTGGVASV